MTEMMTKLAKYVAKEFSVEEDFLSSKERTARIVYPKKVVMYVLRNNTVLTLQQIANAVGLKDHCTVVHHLHDCDGLLSYDESFQGVIERSTNYFKKIRSESI